MEDNSLSLTMFRSRVKSNKLEGWKAIQKITTKNNVEYHVSYKNELFTSWNAAYSVYKCSTNPNPANINNFSSNGPLDMHTEPSQYLDILCKHIEAFRNAAMHLKQPEAIPEFITALQSKATAALSQLNKHGEMEDRSLVFLGEQGVGKSFLINTILRISSANKLKYQLQSKIYYTKGRPLEAVEHACRVLAGWEARGKCIDFLIGKKVVTAKLAKDSPKLSSHLQKHIITDKHYGDISRKCRKQTELDYINSIPKYCEGGDFSNTTPSFLAPSEDLGTPTTNMPVIFQYGQRYQLLVVYEPEQTFRENLITGESDNKREEQLEAVCDNPQQTNLLSITNPANVPILSAVKKVLGKIKIYSGKGKDPIYDRLYIREKLRKAMDLPDDEGKERTTSRSYAVKYLVVFAPSRMLFGSAKVVDVAGANDLGPTRKAILHKSLSEASLVVMVLSKSLVNSEPTIEVLKQSGFLDRLSKDPNANQLVFVHTDEKGLRPKLMGVNSYDKDKTKSKFQKIENDSRGIFGKLQPMNAVSGWSDQQFQQMLECLRWTNGDKILGLLDNILRGSSIHTLAHINAMLVSSRRSLQQLLEKEQLDVAVIALAKQAKQGEAANVNHSIPDLIEKECVAAALALENCNTMQLKQDRSLQELLAWLTQKGVQNNATPVPPAIRRLFHPDQRHVEFSEVYIQLYGKQMPEMLRHLNYLSGAYTIIISAFVSSCKEAISAHFGQYFSDCISVKLRQRIEAFVAVSFSIGIDKHLLKLQKLVSSKGLERRLRNKLAGLLREQLKLAFSCEAGKDLFKALTSIATTTFANIQPFLNTSHPYEKLQVLKHKVVRLGQSMYLSLLVVRYFDCGRFQTFVQSLLLNFEYSAMREPINNLLNFGAQFETFYRQLDKMDGYVARGETILRDCAAQIAKDAIFRDPDVKWMLKIPQCPHIIDKTQHGTEFSIDKELSRVVPSFCPPTNAANNIFSAITKSFPESTDNLKIVLNKYLVSALLIPSRISWNNNINAANINEITTATTSTLSKLQVCSDVLQEKIGEFLDPVELKAIPKFITELQKLQPQLDTSSKLLALNYVSGMLMVNINLYTHKQRFPLRFCATRRINGALVMCWGLDPEKNDLFAVITDTKLFLGIKSAAAFKHSLTMEEKISVITSVPQQLFAPVAIPLAGLPSFSIVQQVVPTASLSQLNSLHPNFAQQSGITFGVANLPQAIFQASRSIPIPQFYAKFHRDKPKEDRERDLRYSRRAQTKELSGNPANNNPAPTTTSNLRSSETNDSSDKRNDNNKREREGNNNEPKKHPRS